MFSISYYIVTVNIDSFIFLFANNSCYVMPEINIVI